MFFKGIGVNNFYFNESSLIDDIKHSVTLNDYCQRDHAYQQSAFSKETENYQIKNYQFSCDYWVRYINIAHELVYATVRSADMDLYWRLEELSRHRVEQAIPHTIKLINLEPDKDEKTTPMEIIVNAQGKEEQLTQLEAFCRDTITKLTQSYCEQISHAEPCVSIYYQEDECTEQYVILVVNNEQAAQQIQLRDFINSIKTLTVPMAIIERDHDDFLQQFTGLFDAELKRLNE